MKFLYGHTKISSNLERFLDGNRARHAETPIFGMRRVGDDEVVTGSVL